MVHFFPLTGVFPNPDFVLIRSLGYLFVTDLEVLQGGGGVAQGHCTTKVLLLPSLACQLASFYLTQCCTWAYLSDVLPSVKIAFLALFLRLPPDLLLGLSHSVCGLLPPLNRCLLHGSKVLSFCCVPSA